MFIRKVKISTRLLTGFGIILLLLCGVAGVGYYSTNKLESMAVKDIEEEVGMAACVAEFRINYLELRRAEKDILLNASNKEKAADCYTKWNKAKSNAKEAIEESKKLIDDEKEKNYIDAFEKAIGLYEDAFTNKVYPLVTTDYKQALAEIEVARPRIHEMEKTVFEFDELEDKKVSGLGKELDLEADVIKEELLLLAIIGIIAAFVLAYFITKSIVTPLAKIVEQAKAVSIGDNSVKITDDSKDEIRVLTDAMNTVVENFEGISTVSTSIANNNLAVTPKVLSEKDITGKALVQMVDNLKQMLGQIAETSKQVLVGAEQISAGSQQLATGNSEQAAAVEEISACALEMSAQASRNAEVATKAKGITNKVEVSVNDNRKVLQDLSKVMEEIRNNSIEIRKITKTIDEVSFQTHILSLNAAVEAARAGKHGRGFSVVAQEVKALADRSTKSAKETIQIIERSTANINEGMKVFASVVESLDGIVKGVGEVSQIISEVNTASQEQMSASDQVSKGLEQIGTVTQQNAASAEENSAASSTLEMQGKGLVEIVEKFKV